MASVVSLFCSYPLWAGERAVKQVHGTSKFVPTIAEIKPMLDEHVRVPKYAAQFDKEAREQLLRLSGPVEVKPTMEELRAKYGPNWGIHDPYAKEAKKHPTLDDLRATYGADVIDAIPDLPPRSEFGHLRSPIPEPEAAE